MMERVLFATDFSESAKLALQLLQNLNAKHKFKVDLLTVIESFWKNWLSSGVYQKELSQRLEVWQEKISQKNAEDCYILQGNPADVILEFVTQQKNDLIVMGAGDKSLMHQITGSTAASVVRCSNQPVLIARKDQLQSIICGIDGSECSKKAMSYAIKLARDYQVKLTLVSVVPSAGAIPFGLTSEELEANEGEILAEHKKMIDKFLANVKFDAVEYETKILWGVPSHVIVNLADDFDYDLIVIGAKGQSRLAHVLMGSTAEKILHRTPASLLVVR